jgi:uncharacterized alpha-E superfamily protein
VLSRVAENLYWMARYLERAEDVARLISVQTNLLLDLPKGTAPGWRSLVTIIGADERYQEMFGNADDEAKVLRFLIADPSQQQSLVASLSAARENARTFREIIPREAWEEINALYLYARDHANDGVSKRGRQTFVKAVIRGSQTITGLLDGCMSHDEPFLFVQLGKNLERADMTTRIIDVRSATLGVETSGAYQNIQWMSVLKSLSGYQMYRQERQTSVSREPALEFLLRSMRFPRSVSFCVHALRANLATMPDRERAMTAIAELEAMLVDPERRALMRDDLPAFIDHLQLVLGSVHDALVAAYFARNDRMAAA